MSYYDPIKLQKEKEDQKKHFYQEKDFVLGKFGNEIQERNKDLTVLSTTIKNLSVKHKQTQEKYNQLLKSLDEVQQIQNEVKKSEKEVLRLTGQLNTGYVENPEILKKKCQEEQDEVTMLENELMKKSLELKGIQELKVHVQTLEDALQERLSENKQINTKLNEANQELEDKCNHIQQILDEKPKELTQEEKLDEKKKNLGQLPSCSGNVLYKTGERFGRIKWAPGFMQVVDGSLELMKQKESEVINSLDLVKQSRTIRKEKKDTKKEYCLEVRSCGESILFALENAPILNIWYKTLSQYPL
ncbi:myosin heavy chain non-muscle [Anaeramoeba flamelloides]|uniref:Myosin heavy chain non-muscle n=1 Tax=Anaeramoeba flamelloides TaxID=1746091 RepID=A0AAV7YSR0_9EUKA|nr:myosin heavy chain non-muscle [Anaeramoeba flamelloides]